MPTSPNWRTPPINRRSLPAANVGFSESRTVEAELYTGDESATLHGLSCPHTLVGTPMGGECVWVVTMSGTLVETGWPSHMISTPTPGPSNTYTTLVVALDSATGDWLGSALRTAPVGAATFSPGAPITAPAEPTFDYSIFLTPGPIVHTPEPVRQRLVEAL